MTQSADITPRLIYTANELAEVLATWDVNQPVVADVETYRTDPKDGKLLGIALCSVARPLEPIYVVNQAYSFTTSHWGCTIDPLAPLLGFFKEVKLVGHGYSYDKLWLDSVLGYSTHWVGCTRLMWHLASAPAGPRPYGLKDAQVEVLGWAKQGDEELKEQIKARGGDLKNGDHYLADVDILGKYACLDAASTAMIYNHFASFFDKHEYWWMLREMVAYSWLLQENTNAGIRVNIDLLESQARLLEDTQKGYASQFQELADVHINRLERIWRDDRASKYTLPAAKERFLASWEAQKKFKLSSDKDKRELFYDSMRLPVVVATEGGKPSTGVEAVKASVRKSERTDLTELMEAYEQTESAETLLNSFVKPWLGAIRGGRLHPRFNPCGTVSYRLSGFKPYLLNAPFAETDLMNCLQCDEGWEGVHADFVSVEPAVTAHYSQDPSLLKVFRDGLGDVYLDLALTLFPGDAALRQGYDPLVPVSSDVKKRFEKQRKVAKIIQLAVQYTGTKHTVYRNLSEMGDKTTLAECGELVDAYWKHFRKVMVMNEALFRRNINQGYLRNVVGRIIRVPFPRYKDLPNRFIQSSAHDLLSLWVLRINDLVQSRGTLARPVILDCHDSTSWQCPKDQIEALEGVFKDALTDLNESVKMTVPIKIEMKRFTKLGGLK